MKNRNNQILEMLTEENKIEVADLATRLGVSQVTIRKDLDTLERQGIIIREHGSALLRSTDDINGRIAYHYEAKKKIAEKAAEMIADGDTLMIESGSCCALLAARLAETRQELTIITNSSFIADYLRGHPGIQVILLGGIYQQDARVQVGPMVRQGAENFYVDYFFIGTDGYSPRTGFSNRDQMRAQAVRDMAGQAEQVVVLTESEKFSRRGIVPLNLKERITTVITDGNIDQEARTSLEDHDINVIEVQ